MKKALKCGKFFCSESGEVLENMVVIVDGKLIEAVVSATDFKADSDYEVCDLSDKFVMPGLIDTHVHMVGDGGSFTFYMDDSVGTTTLRSLERVKRDLMAGFTTLRDASGAMFLDLAVRDAINRGLAWGPRLFCSGVSLGSTGGHGDHHFAPHLTGKLSMAYVVDDPDTARKYTRMNVKYHVDWVKIMATGGVASKGDEPGAQDLTYEEMKAIAETAAFSGIKVMAHAHGARGIKAAVKAGIATIEHGMMADDEALQMMVDAGTWLVPTIIAAKNIAENGKNLPEYMVRKANLALEHHKANLQKGIKMGLNMAFGTDAATAFNPHGKQTDEFKNLVDYGFTPTMALQMATKHAAKLLDKSDVMGSLEKGKYADVVAFDANPIDDITVMNSVSFVMKDGEVYKVNGEPTKSMIV